MHKRSLVLGIGIGIIIGALLLQLFNLGSESQVKLNDISSQINGEQPSEQTSQSENGNSSNEAIEPTASIEPTPATSIEPVQTPVIEESVAPEAEQLLTPEQSAAPTPEPVQTPAAAEVKQYVLRVHPGKSVSQTAKLLVENHIIQDADSFAAYLKEKSTSIRAGFFLVQESSSNEQIRKLVSGEPLTEAERKAYIEVDKLSIIE